MIRSRILGTGFTVPEQVVTNADLSARMDTTDEWIRTRTGIEERHWVREGETGAGLAHAASLKALAMAGLEASELDAIVYATSSPDHFLPGGGVFLQRLLGLAGIPAIDIRMQCSGFIYALSMADAYVATGRFRRILVVGAEIQSTGMDVTTRGRNTAVIFADGAGAVVLGPSESESRGVLAFDLGSDGRQAELLWVDGPGSQYHPRVSAAQLEEGRYYLSMDGREVFRNAVTIMPASVRKVLNQVGCSTGDWRVCSCAGLICPASCAGSLSMQRGDAAHLVHLLHLLLEVLQVEALALAHLVGELLRLLDVDLLVRLLDQRQDVAHAEDARGHALGMERLQARRASRRCRRT